MKLQTQKIIAKEFLVLFISIVITLIVFLSLTGYNLYLKSHKNNLLVEIKQKSQLSDSLNRTFRIITEQVSEHKRELFRQYGIVKGGLNFKGMPTAPLPKNTLIKEEKLGYYIPFWGEEIQNDLEKVYKTSDRNDPLRIINRKFVPIEDLIEKDEDFITENQFSDSLQLNTKFRTNVYNELKEIYDYGNTPTLKSFEEMVGVSIPKNIVKMNNESKMIQTNLNQIGSDLKITKQRIFTNNSISFITKWFFIVSILTLFVLRYTYICLKWSIKTINL